MTETVEQPPVEVRVSEKQSARLFSRWCNEAIKHLDTYPPKLKELFPLGQKNKDARFLVESGLMTLGDLISDFVSNPEGYEVQSYTTERQTSDIQIKGKSLKGEDTHTITTYHIQKRGAVTSEGWRDQILLIAKESLTGELTREGKKEINFDTAVEDGLFSLYQRIDEMKRSQNPETTIERRKKLSGELHKLVGMPIEDIQIVYNRSKFNPRIGQPEVWRIAGIEMSRTYLELNIKGLEFFTGKAAVFANDVEHFSEGKQTQVFEIFRQELVDVAQRMVRGRTTR